MLARIFLARGLAHSEIFFALQSSFGSSFESGAKGDSGSRSQKREYIDLSQDTASPKWTEDLQTPVFLPV
jgi:hypothetical protein